MPRTPGKTGIVGIKKPLMLAAAFRLEGDRSPVQLLRMSVGGTEAGVKPETSLT